MVHRTEFVYTHEGFLRIIKKFDNNVQMDELRIVSLGILPIQERNSSNGITREYAWGQGMGGGIGELLSMRQAGNTYNYLYDGKGNVLAVIDNAQAVAASYRYDSFGRLMVKSGSLDQPFQFSTKRYLSDVGLNYYGYRFYAPSIGRWINRDPLGEAGGINLYGFTKNNPVNWVDPWGLEQIYQGYATYHNLPGSTTASGEIFDPSASTAAMTGEKAKFWTFVTVEYSHTDKNGETETKTCTVKVNDRGPFARDKDGKALKPLQPDTEKIIDLTPKAFKDLADSLGTGKIPVTVRVP